MPHKITAADVNNKPYPFLKSTAKSLADFYETVDHNAQAQLRRARAEIVGRIFASEFARMMSTFANRPPTPEYKSGTLTHPSIAVVGDNGAEVGSPKYRTDRLEPGELLAGLTNMPVMKATTRPPFSEEEFEKCKEWCISNYKDGDMELQELRKATYHLQHIMGSIIVSKFFSHSILYARFRNWTW